VTDSQNKELLVMLVGQLVYAKQKKPKLIVSVDSDLFMVAIPDVRLTARK